jgi:selT/selW/selH-like putative selenoprotein
LAAEIEKQLGVKATLKKGGRGVFDVTADGKLIFSKYKQGRFPEHSEVISALRVKPANA